MKIIVASMLFMLYVKGTVYKKLTYTKCVSVFNKVKKAILCALTMLSLRFHGALAAIAMRVLQIYYTFENVVTN